MNPRISLIALVGMMLIPVANAATTTGTLDVSATVGATCTVTTSAVAFSTTTAPSAQPVANGSVTVNCPVQTSYSIALDAGQNYNASVGRQLSDGNNNLIGYDLYSDPNFSSPWGDDGATVQASSVSDTGDGSDQAHTVYGALVLPANAYVAGQYDDTVNVAVNY